MTQHAFTDGRVYMVTSTPLGVCVHRPSSHVVILVVTPTAATGDCMADTLTSVTAPGAKFISSSLTQTPFSSRSTAIFPFIMFHLQLIHAYKCNIYKPACFLGVLRSKRGTSLSLSVYSIRFRMNNSVICVEGSKLIHSVMLPTSGG